MRAGTRTRTHSLIRAHRRLVADVRHLLGTLRRCHGLRRGGEDTADGVIPLGVVTAEHQAVLAAGQSALDSLDNWVRRHFYGTGPSATAAPALAPPPEPEATPATA